jgi:hypothetical protein
MPENDVDSPDKYAYPDTLVRWARRIKAWLQMAIGVYAVGWLLWSFLLSPHLQNCAAPVMLVSGSRAHSPGQVCYLIPPAVVAFQIVADALAASTVIELAFTLFTPGPDEALDPVLLALAAAILFQLGKVDHFTWQAGVAIILYAVALATLFAVRVFLAPDEDRPPTLWWWTKRIPRRRVIRKTSSPRSGLFYALRAVYVTTENALQLCMKALNKRPHMPR